MNGLTVLLVAALAASSSSQWFGYPGNYGHPGFYGYPGYTGYTGYPGLVQAAAPVTLKTIAHAPVALNTVAATPLTYNVAHVAPVAPVQSQYHAQDELGQYSFGYSGGLSSRAEHRDAFGNVRGSFNYIDSEGDIQTQHYVADALGFRVSGTNLPVAPDAPEVPATLALPGPVPVAVEDTPEVAAAKVAHQAAFEEAAAAAAAAPGSRKKRSIVAASPLVRSYSPLRFSYGFSTPLTYNHPVVGAHPLQYTATVAGVPAVSTFTNAGVPAVSTFSAAGVPAVSTYASGAPLFTPYTAGVPAATTYAAGSAVARNAELLRVVHNPNHAVSYRVD